MDDFVLFFSLLFYEGFKDFVIIMSVLVTSAVDIKLIVFQRNSEKLATTN